MKSIVRRSMLSAAFTLGLAVPFAATWTTPAQALSSCSLLSGTDSWSHTIPGSGSFTVTVDYSTGVSVTGTPPPLVSLPLMLTSTSGHPLTITADPTGARRYEGTFTGETQETCSCAHQTCDYWSNSCVPENNFACVAWNGDTCIILACGGGGGSCTGGVCTSVFDFSAAF